MTGITGYGGYVPKYRIDSGEIARIWGDDPQDIKNGLNVHEKSVPADDEDTATITVEAARKALEVGGLDGEEVEAIYVGSESHPYAVKPTATVVGAAVNATPVMTAADLEFACKAGTAGMQSCVGLVESRNIDYGLAAGADIAQGAPGDALEYSAAAGGAAFLIGKDPAAEITEMASFTTDTPDFWRRQGERFPEHGGRFTGKPAYFRHTIGATERLMEKNDTEPGDYSYAVFHQPNGKFPVSAAEKLGFDESQYRDGLLAPEIGNTYSAASLLGLVNVLDQSDGGERILMTSFGSGAGSDAFAIETREEVSDLDSGLLESLKDTERLDYAEYAVRKDKIKRE
ncbi:MAG: hydroxymethylglutaryl-CoA synthase [Halobacteria archaeon]